MAKLFIAIDLPTATTAELARLQPMPMARMRLVDLTQMHLTLHFVGEAEPAALTGELQELSPPAFDIHVEGTGHFRSASGAITLWAGVRKSPELLSLHSAVADTLRRQGIPTEERPYTPHVTLARCEPEVPEHVVTDFLTRHRLISLPPAPIVRFGLYSSTSVDG
jgi:RNA 2',3'-cyclic 3'-phosphodiesterase